MRYKLTTLIQGLWFWIIGLGFLAFIFHIFLIPMAFMLKENDPFIIGYGKAWAMWAVCFIIMSIFGWLENLMKS